MTMVPFSDRDERILTVDNAGSGLVMYQDKLLGNYQPVKTLIPGILPLPNDLPVSIFWP